MMNSIDAFMLAGAMLVAVVAYFAKTFLQSYLFRYRPQKIMTENERHFFHLLVRANLDGYVFPQVAMSALITPAATQARMRLTAFRRISQKRVDYAIYTGEMELICIVELDDKTHNSSKDAERDQILASAGIRTIRWNSRKKPTIPEIHKMLAQVQESERK